MKEGEAGAVGWSVGVRVMLALGALVALLVGYLVSMLLDGHPASNARMAWVVWALGLFACVLAIIGTRPRRLLTVAAPGVLGLLLGASIVLSAASYPAAARIEAEFEAHGVPNVDGLPIPGGGCEMREYSGTCTQVGDRSMEEANDRAVVSARYEASAPPLTDASAGPVFGIVRIEVDRTRAADALAHVVAHPTAPCAGRVRVAGSCTPGMLRIDLPGLEGATITSGSEAPPPR